MAIHFYGLDDFVFVRLLYRDIYRDIYRGILFFESASVKRNRNGYRGRSKIIRFSSVFSDDLCYPVSVCSTVWLLGFFAFVFDLKGENASLSKRR